MIWIWVGFIAFVLLMLALDLGRLPPQGPRRHASGRRSPGRRCGSRWGWRSPCSSTSATRATGSGSATAADAVDGLVNDGATAADKYLTGYVVEKSLSVDNIFVIAMIFSFFAVPRALPAPRAVLGDLWARWSCAA